MELYYLKFEKFYKQKIYITLDSSYIMVKHLKKACEDYDPERDISGIAGGAYGHYLADNLMNEQEIELREKENELEEKLKFIKEVESMNLDPDNVFSERDIKEKLIREFKGYIRLNKAGQKRKDNQKGELIFQCSDEKIGSVFKDIYYSALNKLKH